MRRRTDLQAAAVKLARRLQELAEPEEWIKPFEQAIPFATYAADWFRTADDQLKRLIVKSAGSNLTLTDNKLSIEAAKWLVWMLGLWGCPIRLGD